MDKNYKEFSVSVYGQLERYNDVLSKARCRIFYKYGNRNGTYITDEFAEKLISSISYAPIKGIYEFEEGDYSDHGEARTEGRIYGIVPENPNFAWEDHLDEDGVLRTYACVDVLIFTALYEEAGQIVGKSQSMELYEPSLKYHQAIVHGQRYIVFDEGCFLGLQVLGDNVEPCFEGASFFSLQESIESVIDRIKQASVELTEVGGTEMPTPNFKLSDNQKFEALWILLNPEYNSESEWTITYTISDIYDDYALAFNYETGNYERIYYAKNDETDMVEITGRMPVFIMDITAEERETLSALRKLNGDTYELVNPTLENAESTLAEMVEISNQNAQYTAQIEEFATKIEEFESSISTLNTEKEAVRAQYDAAQASIEALNAQIDELKLYKYNVELAQKQEVISTYADQLADETIEQYTAEIDNYTAEELDMRLTYELKKANPTVFNKNTVPNAIFPKDNPKSGIEAILEKYRK